MREIIKSIEEVERIADPKDPESSYFDFSGFKITTDQQEIFLLIDNVQSCCETSGYFVCDDNYSAFIGEDLISISVVNKDLCKKVVLDKLMAELDYGSYDGDPFDYMLDSGDIMFVEIMTSKGPFQFAAYNSHNGYYGHEAMVVSKQLTYEVSL